MSNVNALKSLTFVLKTKVELNHAYMPFISGGGIFVPTTEPYALGESVLINLELPNENQALAIEGKIVWITPKHALYQAIQGVGIEFTGPNAQAHCHQIETHLDPDHEVGGYTYWIDEDLNK